ncbi:hypothetical protein QR680_014415 [Steinernema hermaphroditum]|uniref:non-specific serine/threonine protein kinase n=1 Tax=Steinernema hermaphroditum TaxID=289476 RepID=A0AA39IBE0_9BILA|nr:hypothetical protein QR680_014415 [Steinernema hermaphroditum]
MPPLNRRRRKALEATILVDVTLARPPSAQKKINFEETFLCRTRIPQKGRKKKDKVDEEFFTAVCAAEQSRLEEQRRQIEQLKARESFAFSIESANKYHQELHDENKKQCEKDQERRKMRKEARRSDKKHDISDTDEDAFNVSAKRQEINDGSSLPTSPSLKDISNTSSTGLTSLIAKQSLLETHPEDEEPQTKTTRRSSRLSKNGSPSSTSKQRDSSSLKDMPNASSTGMASSLLAAHPEANCTETLPTEEPQRMRRSARIANKRSIEPTIEFDPSPKASNDSIVLQSTTLNSVGSPLLHSRLSDIEKSWQSPSYERMPRVSASKNADKTINCFYLENYVGSDCPLGELLHVCGQSDVIDFEEVNMKWKVKSKLGEGVYGEVYLVSWEGQRDLAVKVIPFHGYDDKPSTIRFNGELLKSARSMLPEVVMTRELSALREGDDDMTDGFVELQNAAVVKGKYPRQLVNKWDEYDLNRGSENDPPSTYSSPEQMYLLLCLGVAGHDLENFAIKNLKEAASIFTQVAFSLMVAEHAMEFEHRDLHVGNILVSREKVPEVISYKYEGNEYHFASHGVKATIIDFTNSRMRKEATVIYVDLEQDPDLFTGEGDYQFDIYRMMRAANEGSWRTFDEYNNLVWMHYLSTKIFEKQKRLFKKLEAATENMLKCNYTSISEYIISDEFAPIFSLVDQN